MSSDLSRVRRVQVPIELAVCDFGHFLPADKGPSAATRECYVRHVRPILAEVWVATGTGHFGGCQLVGAFLCHAAGVAGIRKRR